MICKRCGLEHTPSWTCEQAKANSEAANPKDSQAKVLPLEQPKPPQTPYDRIKANYWSRKKK